MDIMQILKENMVCTGLKAKSKNDLIKQISNKFETIYNSVSSEDIRKALMDREALGSTGFGKGIALPHAKVKGLDFFSIFVGTLKTGVDFGSRDKKKVKLVLGILGPEGRDKEYLRFLAQVSKMIREERIVKEMLSASNDELLYEVFIRNFLSLTEQTKPHGEDESKKLLILHLKEQRFLQDIINLLVENRVYNTVISDSSTFEDYVSKSALFGGFLDFLSERSGTCKTITAVVPEVMIPKLVKEIEKIMGDLDNYTGISITALDIIFHKGTLT